MDVREVLEQSWMMCGMRCYRAIRGCAGPDIIFSGVLKVIDCFRWICCNKQHPWTLVKSSVGTFQWCLLCLPVVVQVRKWMRVSSVYRLRVGYASECEEVVQGRDPPQYTSSDISCLYETPLDASWHLTQFAHCVHWLVTCEWWLQEQSFLNRGSM